MSKRNLGALGPLEVGCTVRDAPRLLRGGSNARHRLQPLEHRPRNQQKGATTP